MKDIRIDTLVGEVLTHVDIDEEHNQIQLTTESGRIVTLHHVQDCCEYVCIEDTNGDWLALVGKPLVESSEHVVSDFDGESHESSTETTFTFKVDGATVINRWIGSSNGYYSEHVDISEITKTLAQEGTTQVNESDGE